MIIEFRLTYVDGSVLDAETSAVSVVACERHFNGASVVGLFLGAEPRIEALYWLAWKSLEVAGRPVGEFDAWLATVRDVTVTDGSAASLPPPPPR